jgi:hypothetical protein
LANFITASAEGAVRQGELLSGVLEIVPTPEFVTGDGQDLIPVRHDHVVVLSQDCDLDWDYKSRSPAAGNSAASAPKLMASILLCKVDTASDVRSRSGVNRTTWDRIKINKDERYHFLEETLPEYDALGKGLPELCIDFKTYIGIPAAILYHQIAQGLCCKRGRLVSPYLEHLTQRFSAYLSRVALPEDYRSRPEG